MLDRDDNNVTESALLKGHQRGSQGMALKDRIAALAGDICAERAAFLYRQTQRHDTECLVGTRQASAERSPLCCQCGVGVVG